MERVRIPGFCAYKHAVEAWILMELIAVRLGALWKLHSETGNSEKLRKLDRIQAVVEQIEPMLSQSLADLEVYSSLDGRQQFEAMAKRFRKANTVKD